VKLRSSLYDNLGEIGGLGVVDLLASFALFDDDPARINTLESHFDAVTPELLQKTAQEYLRPGNRTASIFNQRPHPRRNSREGIPDEHDQNTLAIPMLILSLVTVAACAKADSA